MGLKMYGHSRINELRIEGKTMKITAVFLASPGHAGPYSDTKPLTLAEIDLAPPGPDELLVKIEAAGLCHSDLSVINGDRPRPMPMAIGHEAVATVLSCGAHVAAHNRLAVCDQ